MNIRHVGSKGLILMYSADREPTVAAVVVHILADRMETEVPRKVGTSCRVERTRPIEAITASAVERTAPTVTSSWKKEAVAIGTYEK